MTLPILITLNDTTLVANETTLVTIEFMGQSVPDLKAEDLISPDGTFSNLQSTGEGASWTALFVPNAGVENASSVISLSSNIQGGASSDAFTIDTKAPTASIVVSDNLLTNGETSPVTIVFSEAVTGFVLGDLSAQNGVLSNLSTSDNITYAATFTPNANIYSDNNVITLATNSVVDVFGNGNGSVTTSNAYNLRTYAPPTVTVSVDDTALKTGETPTVTFAFSEQVSGFTAQDVSVGSGTLGAITRVGSTNTYTATLTPTSDVETANNVVSVNMTGVTGYNTSVAGVGTASSQIYSVDTKAPTVGIRISDDNVGLDETATVTVTFSDRMASLDANRVTAENGTLSTFSSADEGLTWTATFTPDPDVARGEGYSRLDFNAAGLSDAAGNETVVNSGYYHVNAASPIATVTLDDSALKSHETTAVTITFSETVGDFDLTDVKVGSGTLNGLTTSDEGKTWHATLTPAAGVEDYTNVVSVDLAGIISADTGIVGSGTAVSANYVVDTKGPSATITMSDKALRAGETSVVTITFSEPVPAFNPVYMLAPNGTLGPLATSDEGTTWTTTFTPKADVSNASSQIQLNLGFLVDLAGNLGTGVIKSDSYTVNTMPPVVVTPPTPTPTPTVDGVPVRQTSGTAADGSKTQVISVPTVTAGRVDKDGNAALADIPLVKTTAGGTLLSVGVPVGFGVKANGSTSAKSAEDSLTNLIAEIKAHSTGGSAAQESMVGGGSGFLAALGTAPLLVQTIEVTAPSGTDVTKGALVVSGNAAAGTPQTALVIDTKSLPAGATIELQNVDFAAIMGAVKLRGGEGQQTIYGDSASQDIFLGADDDILHGGAGNDIVGSAGGNDQIFGDEGDDIVFGGEGNDMIDGGTGYDVVRLAGAKRAEYSFRVDDGKLVMTHLNGGSDGTDIVGNVEALRFAGASTDVAFRDTDVASLVRMYETTFDRNADEAGLNFWIGRSEAGVSLHDIAVAMVSSTEAQARFNGMSDAAFIQALYLQGLDRAGTAQESKVWIDALTSGAVSRGDALLGFADSAEKIALVGFMDTSITTA